MIKFLLLLIVVATYASAYVVTYTGDDELTTTRRPLLGQKMCTRGPAYWCHNITHAKDCHAVHHCISKVWEDMVLPEDNDSVCQICKEMVQQARDQLLSNETQDELRQVLEGSCKLIPLKIISKECIQLSDEFIPELVDTLASRMDPQAVCSVSGLCNSIRIDEMLGELKPVDSGNPVRRRQNKFDLHQDSCPKCNYYLGKATNFLKTMKRDDLEDKIFQICGRFGSYSDSCRAIVASQMDSIYNHVQSRVNSEEICGLVGLCEVSTIHKVSVGKPSTAVRVWSPATKNDDLPCDFCKQLAVHVRDWLVANTTQSEFSDMIRGLCKQTGSFRKECLSLAKQYSKPLYQLLIDEVDPDRVCGILGVCPNQGKFKLFSPISTLEKENEGNDIDDDIETAPMLEILPGEKLAGNDERNAIERENKIRGKAECEFCEYALHYLQTYIENPREEEQVKEAVDKLCNKLLPREMASQCTQFVSEYGSSLIVLIAQEIDPSVICPKLGVCATVPVLLGSGDIKVERVPIVKKDHMTKLTDVPTCPLCHFAVSRLIHMLGENRTKAAVDEALDSVCYVLPRTVKPQCINFMTYYGNRIGEMLVIELSAREICMALGLCILPATSSNSHRIIPPPAVTNSPKIVVDSMLPLDRFMPQTVLTGEVERLKEIYPLLSSRLTPSSQDNSQVNKGEQCVICEFAITQIAQRLENNATEEEIKETVEHACLYLPKTVRAQCKTFVDSYSDLIVAYLAQSLDPTEVCTKLGLCSGMISEAFAEALRKLEQIENVTMGQCQLCMVLSDYLSAMLEDPKIETSVDRIVEKICPIMPRKYRNQCKEMVENYGPYLLSLLAQATDKGKACSTLNLCPNTHSVVVQ